MRKPKRILSVLLAMLMVCSTLAIGANAAYSEYKDNNIQSYDSIDKPVFTAAQLASVALDEVDRMLMEMDTTSIKVPIINVTIDYSSIDKALNSLAKIYNGSVWNTVTSIAGDLKNLNFAALNIDPNGNFAANGCRRTTAGKTDLDVLYSVISFLYDNRALLASYGYGTLDIGATLGGLLGDQLSDYLDAPKLVKDLLYKEVNGVERPDGDTTTVDALLQKMIKDMLDTAEGWLAEKADYGITFEFSNLINISSGSLYDNVETVLQYAWNNIFVPMANTKLKQVLLDALDAPLTSDKAIKQYVKNDSGNYVLDKQGQKTTKVIGYYLDDTPAIVALRSNPDVIFPAAGTKTVLQAAVEANAGKTGTFSDVTAFVKLDYVIPTHDFTGSDFVSELNNLLADVVGAVVTAQNADITWTRGSNNNIIPNLLAAAKTLLKTYGERYLSDYVTIPTDDEIDALTLETAVVRFGKELVNKYVAGALIPDTANTVRAVLSFALLELIAEDEPSKDLYTAMMNGTIDPNSDNGWKAILAVFARHYANAYTNMNIPDNLTFDQTIAWAVDWALSNYGGILYYTSQIDPNKDAWQKLDEAIFTLIPLNWLPTQARVLRNGTETWVDITGSKVLILDVLLGNILDLKFNYLLDLLARNNTGELNNTVVAVVLARVRAILNAIIPGTITTNYNTLEQVLTKQSLGDIINGLISGINSVKVSLITSALPLVCQILKLTTEQALDDPAIIYPSNIINANRSFNGTAITIRNNSSGVNTGYTDANGNFHQDALYKVKIKSITTNNNAVSVTYTANDTLNGGIAKTYPVTGSLSADGLVRFCVSYEILDETGASLTSSPITSYFFTYMSADHADDDADYYGLDADGYPLFYVDGTGMNDHYIIAAPHAYVYTWGQLEDVSFSIGRDSTDRDYMEKDAYVSMTDFSTTMPGTVLSAPEIARFKTTYGGYIGDRDLFTVTIPQVDDPENPGKTINDEIGNYAGTYTASTALHFDETGDGFGAADYTVTRTLHIYDDFGLNSLVSGALRANRQRADFAAGATNAWNAYLTALTNAQAVLLKPKTAATFNPAVYEGLATALKDAIDALDEFAEGAGVDSLIALKEQYAPDNEEGLKYYEDGYHFFGSQDYVLYTFERYRTHRNNMNDLIDSQIIDEPGAPEDYKTPEAYEEAVAAYEKALADRPTLSLFDVTYRGHMYQMNAERMIRRPASKNYLNIAYNIVSEAVLGLDETAYSNASWSALTHAIDFAEAVIADSDPDIRQTKINTAREELIYAYKNLAEKVPADYAQLDQAIEAANRIYETEGYESMYTGLEALDEAYAAAIALDRNLDSESQADIDAAAKALNDALDGVAVLEGLQVETDEEVLAGAGYGDPIEDGGYGWRPEISDFYNAYDEETGDPLQALTGLVYEQDASLLETVIKGGSDMFEYVEGENNTSGLLATGDKIIGNDGTVLYLVIYGDCNGDGSIDINDASDIAYMCDWMLEESEYGGIFTTAGDIIGDESITIDDYSYLLYLIDYFLEVDVYTFPQDGSFEG